MIKKIPLLLCLTIYSMINYAQLIERSLRTESGTINYLISLPEEYSFKSEQTWPVLFFLHGAGERGDDLAKVKVHGPPKMIEGGHDYPFIVVAPQCRLEEQWASPVYLNMLDALYLDLMSTLNIDKSRVYLSGLSMGGQGTWEWGKKRHKWFAAMAPICGYGSKQGLRKLRYMPIWVFHGALDQVVPIEQSDNMVGWLKQYGSQVKYTIYPEANHDSWTETYANPELYTWLLSQKKELKK